MKKTLFAAVALLAVAAQADYMYWMVDSSNVSSDYTWDTAKLIQDSTAIGTLSKEDADFLSSIDSYAYSQLNDPYNSSTFFIELYNGTTFVAESEHQTYANVKSSIFGSNQMNPSIAAGGGFMPTGSTYNVPEPTSGLLFLVGGMLLGLKRRRQQV